MISSSSNLDAVNIVRRRVLGVVVGGMVTEGEREAQQTAAAAAAKLGPPTACVLSFGFDCCRSAVTELYFDRDAAKHWHHRSSHLHSIPSCWLVNSSRQTPQPPSSAFTHVTKESKATMLSATARASWQAARRCVTAAAATGARGSSKRALHASTAANATAYKAPLTEVQFLLKDVYNVQDR